MEWDMGCPRVQWTFISGNSKMFYFCPIHLLYLAWVSKPVISCTRILVAVPSLCFFLWHITKVAEFVFFHELLYISYLPVHWYFHFCLSLSLSLFFLLLSFIVCFIFSSKDLKVWRTDPGSIFDIDPLEDNIQSRSLRMLTGTANHCCCFHSRAKQENTLFRCLWPSYGAVKE